MGFFDWLSDWFGGDELEDYNDDVSMLDESDFDFPDIGPCLPLIDPEFYDQFEEDY